MLELNKLTRADFSPYLNQTFYICPEGMEPFAVELIQAQDSTFASPVTKRKPFSLIFRGPPEFYVPQRIYKIEHDEMGTLELFIVPIGPDERGMRYQAVFS